MSNNPAAAPGANGQRGERGVALVTALLLTVLLFVLAIGLLAISGDESGIAANETWSEGAFYAAEAGLQSAVDQIGPDPALSLQAVPLTTIAQGYTFRSGRRSDTTPQPVRFVRSTPAAGFALGVGTGYNAAGFLYETYEVDATGLGPRNAQREIEAQVLYGPVAR